jgi:hypothetical protein
VLIFAVRAFGAEAKSEILAYLFVYVRHRALLLTFFTKTDVVVRAFFLASITSRDNVTVYTLITLLTIAFLEKIAAYWDLVLVEDVQVIALVALFALAFEPVYAYYFLML